jgi:DNA invertase Pin-like site-specific DNA recombinase
MKIGYARVSTRKQRLDLQYRALADAGCRVIISETSSGRQTSRKALAAALALASRGDEIVVWKLDRLSRDPFELMKIARLLREGGIALRILNGQAASIDISTNEGLALFAMYAGTAAIEAEANSERAKAGRAASRLRSARERGRVQPRPKLALRRAFNRLLCG